MFPLDASPLFWNAAGNSDERRLHFLQYRSLVIKTSRLSYKTHGNSVGADTKQHIMSGLLNLSSIKGEAIYFASTHTSRRPRAYVLVTGSDSNGEFNCLGRKINKRHRAASQTSWFFYLRCPELAVLRRPVKAGTMTFHHNINK